MKVERWNKETQKFEIVDLSDDEFEKMFIILKIAESEAMIYERMDIIREEDYTNICQYD